MIPVPAAERRHNVSHGREPVDAINAMDTSPIGAAQDGVGLVLSLRDWPLGRYTVHGLAPVANIVAPLRGWNRIIQNS